MDSWTQCDVICDDASLLKWLKIHLYEVGRKTEPIDVASAVSLPNKRQKIWARLPNLPGLYSVAIAGL